MPGAEITTIIDSDLSGRANDGDPNTKPNPGTYKSKAAVGPTKAQDGATKSESYVAQAKQIGDNVHAIPEGNGSAVATSFNAVTTGFKIDTQGAYQFTIALEVKGIKREGSGKVTIQHRANILSANGTVILDGAGKVRPDTNLSDTTYTVDGKKNKLSTGSTVPEKGVTLAQGLYHLEVELRLIAEAPASDGPRSTAEIDDAKFSISLN
jgi:hypothetical protein